MANESGICVSEEIISSRQRNTRESGLVRLPPELVVRVCQLNADLDHNLGRCTISAKPHPRGIPSSLQDTLTASQICHHWRIVLISSPELWRHFIDTFHPCSFWTELLLKRSEPLSIEFVKSRYAPEDQYDLPDLNVQMQHKVHLRLHSYHVWLAYHNEPVSRYTQVWPSEPSSWPKLQRLCLCFYTEESDENLQVRCKLQPPRKLPKNFPGSATPILQRLDLSNCYMSEWRDLIDVQGTLTHLSIHQPPFLAALKVDQWIDILRNLPRLEYISLTSAVFAFRRHKADSSPPDPAKRFTLDVQRFFFEDSPALCVSFLDAINLPPKCCFFEVIPFGMEFPEDDVKAVLSQVKRLYAQIDVASTLNRHPALGLLSSTIEIDGLIDPARPFQGWRSTGICERADTNLFGCFHVSFTHCDEHGTIPSTLAKSTILPALLEFARPLQSSFEIIHVVHSTALTDQRDFLQFLFGCQKVRAIKGLPMALWNLLRRSIINSPEPLFPNLRAIDFDYTVLFLESRQGRRTLVNDMKAFCEHRKSIGLPFEKFRIFAEVDLAGMKSQLGPLGVSIEAIDLEDRPRGGQYHDSDLDDFDDSDDEFDDTDTGEE